MNSKAFISAVASIAFISALQPVRAEISVQSDLLEVLTAGCKRGEPEQCSQLFDHVEKSNPATLISTFELICPAPGEGAQRFHACLQLARSYFINSDYQPAANIFSKYCKNPGHQICAYYGSSLFHAGNQIQGWTVVRNYAVKRKLIEHCSGQNVDSCYEVACLHSLHFLVSGNSEAITHAESALRIAAKNSPDFDWNWALRDPDLEPLRRLGILQKIRSEQEVPNRLLSTANGEIGRLELIKNRSIIEALVRETKKREEGMELLEPGFYSKAYSTKLRCNSKKIFLLSDFDLSIPDLVAKVDNRGFPLVGSGGHQLRIFLQDKKGNLSLAWSRVVIGVVKFELHGTCPDLLVELHGGEFGRAGNLYGLGRLRFGSGKFSILMRNGKTVEEKNEQKRGTKR